MSIIEAESMELLLRAHGTDFELWKEEREGYNLYHLTIEGYIGFQKIEDFVTLYEIFLKELHDYLIKNKEKYPKKERRVQENRVYSTRAIEIYYNADCYWVYLDTYTSLNIWDTYYYLADVIDQLKQVKLS